MSKIAVSPVVVVELVVVVEGVVLAGIYSGLQCRRPETTAQYFIHNKLRYCTLTKTVTEYGSVKRSKPVLFLKSAVLRGMYKPREQTRRERGCSDDHHNT